jgi:hypothetical protein
MSRKRIVALAALALLFNRSAPPAIIAVEAPHQDYVSLPESLFARIMPEPTQEISVLVPNLLPPTNLKTPIPSKPRAKTVTISGTASYYDSWCGCTAMTNQIWRGKIVVIVGPLGHVRVRITDAGPVPSLHRVADLPPSIFTKICGPLSIGLCHVTIYLDSK